jgi:hypothetical protein
MQDPLGISATRLDVDAYMASVDGWDYMRGKIMTKTSIKLETITSRSHAKSQIG